MKRTLKTIIAASVLALCLTGCEKEIFSSFSEIKFKAGTVAGPKTKTEYGDSLNKVQRVDWRAGDLVRITSLQAAQDTTDRSIHYADYVVQSNGTPNGRNSVSTISAQNRGLHWGDKDSTHVFYSVYPSPGTRGKSSDSLNEYGDMQGNIPATQSPLSVSSSAPYVAAPDMIHQYMVAKRTVSQGIQKIAENEVFLYYTPITTAIEFEVTNGMTDTLAIASIDLISASHNLSGTFTCSLKGLSESGGTYPDDVAAATGASKSASVSFGTAGLKLAKDQKLTFTIFLLPEDNLDDLTFRINKSDGKYIQALLKSNDTGNPYITFARCKKHFVKGLFVNEGAKWTLCFNPDVDPWGDNTDIDQDLEDPHLGLLPSLIKWEAGESTGLNLEEKGFVFTLKNGSSDASQTFSGDLGDMTSDTRVKTIPITSTQGDEDQSWSIKTVNGTTVTGNSITIKNDLENDVLKIEKVANSTGTGYDLKVTDLRKKVSNGDHAHWTHSAAGNWYKADWSTTNATSSAPMDLSKYDFESDAATTTMSTANCYIVRHAGTYKIPLVYGNGVDGGSTNSASYAPTIASGGSNGLTPFVNHLGNPIFSPFIENNRNAVSTNTSFSNTYRLKAKSASVLWQDVSGVIGNVTVTGHSANTSACTQSNCGYITFTVNASNIQQCNAVIAVYDGTGGTGNILWSWHIWITNNPDLGSGPESLTHSSTTYNFLPMPCLGWIDPLFYEENDDITIVLEQDDTQEKLEVVIKQEETDPDNSNGTYYQWGRKDPMRASGNSLGTGGSSLSIAEGIKNPGKFYTSGDNWCSSNVYNLWTGKYSVASTSAVDQTTNMIKTIYDPSPVGYKVPASGALECTGLTFTPVGYIARTTTDGKKSNDSAFLYWSATSASTNGKGANSAVSFYTPPFLSKNKAEGFAVRPVQE